MCISILSDFEFAPSCYRLLNPQQGAAHFFTHKIKRFVRRFLTSFGRKHRVLK